MSWKHPYRGNDPIEEMGGESDESEDLQAIRRDMEMHRLSQDVWQHLYPDGDNFRHEFDQVAEAAQDWGCATYSQRFRALRILARQFGIENVHLLIWMASPKSHQDWLLQVRRGRDTELIDGGKRRKEWEREHWDYVIAREVYSRIKEGQSKSDAIAAVKEDYRLGNPVVLNLGAGLAPMTRNREVRHLPSHEGANNGMDKILNRFRRSARKRGYINPYAASGLLPFPREPDLKLSDLPKRGRPRKK